MNRKKIVILTPFRDADIDLIKASAENCELVVVPDPEETDEVKLLSDADICIGEPGWDAILASKTLKLLQMTWAGTDKYTRAGKAFPEGAHLCNASGAFGPTMAQHAIGAVLSLCRNFPAYQKNMLQHEWKRASIEKSVIGTTVLIFGSGNIGSCSARLFRALGASRIIGVRRGTSVPEHFDAVCNLAEAENFLPEADIVLACMPNTDENQNYLNEARLNQMKDDAVLVNIGRGPFVDDLALAAVLKAGKLRGAALDVTEPEPLPADHTLWDCERLILTPHVAGLAFGNPQTEHLIAEICAENISRFLRDEPLMNQVI